MKNTILQMMMIVGLVACSVSFAEAQNTGLYRADVPFDFSVGKRQYTAGVYSIEIKGSEKKYFILRDSAGRNAYAVGTMPGESNPDVAALDFNRVGDHYSLTAIRMPDLTSTLPKPKNIGLLSRNTEAGTKVTVTVSRGR